MSVLNGFEEDINTTNFSSLERALLTTNSVIPSTCFQDSVPLNEAKGDGDTPSIQRDKKKLNNDNVGASNTKTKKTYVSITLQFVSAVCFFNIKL